MIDASQTNVTAAVLLIGNEILSGRTADTNGHYLAKQLGHRGIRLCEIRVVPDVQDTIVKAVRELSSIYTYVFSTGGIGPTHDDITTAAMGIAFDTKIVEDPEALACLIKRYGETGLTPARCKMALIPEGAKLIHNPVTDAPGYIVQNVYVMAGVPQIMQAMFEGIADGLTRGAVILSETIKTILPESAMAETLEKFQNANTDLEIGSYPHIDMNGRVDNSVVIRGINQERVASVAQDLLQILRQLEREKGSPS